MKEPSIIWNPIRYRQQESNECVANAIAACLEKLYQIKGEDVEIDENKLDDYLREKLNDYKGGISAKKALWILGVLRWNKVKLRFWRSYLQPEKIIDLIIKGPLLLTIQTYKRTGKRIQKIGTKWYYKEPTEEKRGKHLVVILGWDSLNEEYIILDSNYNHLVYMTENQLKQRFCTFYYVKI